MTNHIDFTTSTPARWIDMDVDARTTAVRALAALGQSSAQIALALRTTRNAVLGLAGRKKITIGGGVSRRVTVQAPVFPIEPPVPDETWAPLGPPVSLLDRRDDQCAWPVGAPEQRLFCGGVVHRRGYCQHHYDMAFVHTDAIPVAPHDENVGRPSINRRDRRALVHGGKAQHYEGAE